MLFWSFVLAFILSVLYYLTPVHNTVEIEDKPMADTFVSTFVSAHQAAKRLTYIDTAKTICVKVDDKGEVEIGSNGLPIEKPCILKDDGTIDKEKNFEVEDPSERFITFTYKDGMHKLKTAYEAGFEREGILSIHRTPLSRDGVKKYSDGTLAYIDPDEIEKMIPVAKDAFKTYVADQMLTSAFVCITDKGEIANFEGTYTDVSVNPYLTFDCQGGKGGSIVSDEQKASIGDYVITYMRAPASEYSEISRNELWRSAILRRTKGSHECGVLWRTENGKISVSTYQYDANGNVMEDNDGNLVVVERAIPIESRKKYDENSPYIMDNSRRFTISVPQLIGDALAADSELLADMNSGYLLFCITPIDDIQGSFEHKCKKGYGKYTIKNYDVSLDPNDVNREKTQIVIRTDTQHSECP